MPTDEKFAACWLPCLFVSILFFQFNRNAKLKQSLLIWDSLIFGLFFLTWSALRIWRAVHSVTLLLVFLCPQLLIVPLIIWMNIKKTKFCGSCGRTIHTGMQPLKNDCCPKCGAPIE
jgi:hypothetical protein